MRIGFLHDQRFTQRPGGATRLAERLYAAAPSDHETVWLTADQPFDADCDAYVLVQTKFYPDDVMAQVLARPFARYELDYWAEGEPGSKYRDPLNEAARAVWFVSPLHRDVYQFRHHLDLAARSDVIPCAMDPAEFAPIRERWANLERQDAIWYGEWAWGKGPDIAMKWAVEHGVMTNFYSPTMPPTQKPPNRFTRLHGMAPEEGWWDVIASHQQFVHFPRQPECFCYGSLEAYALGLEVNQAGRVGWESYGLPIDELLQLCAGGAASFWTHTLDALGG